MHTFIKYKDQDNFYLLLNAGEELSWKMKDSLQSRFVKTTFMSSLKAVAEATKRRVDGEITREMEEMIIDMEARKTRFIREQPPINHEENANKYGAICIHKKGSWTSYTEENVEQIVQSEKWPYAGGSADIIICENDPTPETAWVEYLQNRYPGKTIQTINFFSTMTEEEIMDRMKNAELITFSTTFSSTDWFLKMVRCMTDGQTILGYCHDSEMWNRIETDHLDIEIVASLLGK